MVKLSEQLKTVKGVDPQYIADAEAMERELEALKAHAIDLETRLDADPHIKADVYDNITELLEPYIERQGKVGGFLPASVTDSVTMLLECTETLKESLTLNEGYRNLIQHTLSILSSEESVLAHRDMTIAALSNLAGPDVPVTISGRRLLMLERSAAIMMAVRGAEKLMQESLENKTDEERKALDGFQRGYRIACEKIEAYAEAMIEYETGVKKETDNEQ